MTREKSWPAPPPSRGRPRAARRALVRLAALSLAGGLAWGAAPPEREAPHDAGALAAASSIAAIEACSLPRDPAPVLEFTYDAEPVVGGGRIEDQGAEAWSLHVSDDVARQGTSSVRSELRYGDAEAFGGPRAETAVVRGASDYAAGTEFHYGFSVYLAAGWLDDGDVEDIVFQWHAPPDSELGERPKSPNLFLAVKNGQFVLRITSDAALVSSDASPLREQAVLVDALDTTGGTWHDFVFHVSWSYDADGWIEAWHKTASESTYRQVLGKAGPNLHNDTNRGYVKWGIYKPAWRGGASAVPARVLHHDEIRVGASFGAVEPGCGPGASRTAGASSAPSR